MTRSTWPVGGIGKKLLLTVALFVLTIGLMVNSPLHATEGNGDATGKAKKALVAFPGAEGFGRFTTGGRGGEIVFVTNTNASGPGSFREAATMDVPRIIIFKTGGTIDLNTDNVRVAPNATIFAQTAPGEDGVMITNGTVVLTENIIVRGLRSRAGDPPTSQRASSWDSLRLDRGSDRIIIDQSSFSWGTDGSLDLFTGRLEDPIEDVTVQWSIVSETLFKSLHPKGSHSRGMVTGDYLRNITIHHNLYMYNEARNPSVKGDARNYELINNVSLGYRPIQLGSIVYDDRYQSEWSSFKQVGHVIGNWYHRTEFTGSEVAEGGSTPAVYLQDNGKEEEMLMVEEPDETALRPLGDMIFTKLPLFSPTGVTAQHRAQAKNLVVEHAGAIIPQRDAADLRATQDTGSIIDSVAEVGGVPQFDTGSYPTDSDEDGIPDAWETENELDPNDPRDAGQPSVNGYMWIEEYANSLYASSQAARAEVPTNPDVPGPDAPIPARPVRAKIDTLEYQVVQADSDQIEYSGSWTEETIGDWRGTWTFMRTNSLGSEASLTFEGSGIKFRTSRGEDFGIFEVLIDGVSQGVFDSYYYLNQLRKWQYETHELPKGTHTITIRYTGTKNELSTATDIGIDYFQYY